MQTLRLFVVLALAVAAHAIHDVKARHRGSGPCDDKKGVCQLNTLPCAGGSYISNLCPGLANNIKCCVPGGAAPAPAAAGGGYKKLQPFASLWPKYPGGEAAEAKARIGGAVNAAWITNTCTIRISRAFNLAGDPIPKNFRLTDGSGKPMAVVSGADKSWHAIRVKEFNQYMRKTYGPPTLSHQFTDASGKPTDGGDIPESFLKKSGVIMFEVKIWSDATGHFDLWDGDREMCGHECYYNKARSVHLWVC